MIGQNLIIKNVPFDLKLFRFRLLYDFTVGNTVVLKYYSEKVQNDEIFQIAAVAKVQQFFIITKSIKYQFSEDQLLHVLKSLTPRVDFSLLYHISMTLIYNSIV